MANVIPLAGVGSRFLNSAYHLPKPLIEISGRPMILKAIENLPPSEKWIFIVREDHLKEHHIDQIIKTVLPQAIIISVNKTTLGQACTCLLAQAYVHPDEPLLVAACDNSSVYDPQKFQQLTEHEDIDCIVWTVTGMEKMNQNPQAYGWVVLEDDGTTINSMSVKKPISVKPSRDHAVTATFYFKKAKDFFDAVNLMILEEYKINSEYYIDAVPIYLKKLEKKSVIFDVDQFICWGTPDELNEYQSWERFFKENKLYYNHSNSVDYLFWKKYFTR